MGKGMVSGWRIALPAPDTLIRNPESTIGHQ
jgi:hypothetical protein